MKTMSSFVKMIFFAFSILAHNLYAFDIKDYEKKIKNSYAIRNVVDKLTRKALEDNLREFIVQSRPNRIPGTAGHTKAKSYLEEKLKTAATISGTFSKEDFGPETAKGSNFIWEKKGVTTPNDVLILGARFDNALVENKDKNKKVTSLEMPGADNNASGVAALLSLVEILARLDLPKTVKVVFFDMEESDLAGSKAFLEKFIPNIGSQRIVGFIDVNMIGHDTKREDKTGKLGNMKIYTRGKEDKGHELDFALASLIQSNGKRLHPLIDLAIEDRPQAPSEKKVQDSATNFWQLGLPAIIVTGDRVNDFNPRFQSSNDFYETLNLMTYNNVFRYLSSSVLAWNYDIVK